LAEFDLPTPNAQPWDIALGGDGALWFTEENADQIGRVAVDGTISEFGVDQGSLPTFIAADAAGKLWFTEELGNAIVHFKPRGLVTPDFRTITVPTEGALPWDVAPGPNGTMWFTELVGRNVGRISPKGHVKEFPIPGDLGIAGITRGSDGNMWFTENDIALVGGITFDGTLLSTISTRPYPFGITSGPDGNLWVCEGYGDAIARVRLS
jgi:virginiamycin B lyase